MATIDAERARELMGSDEGREVLSVAVGDAVRRPRDYMPAPYASVVPDGPDYGNRCLEMIQALHQHWGAIALDARETRGAARLWRVNNLVVDAPVVVVYAPTLRDALILALAAAGLLEEEA